MFLVPSFWSSSKSTGFPCTMAVMLGPGEQLLGSLGNTLCPRKSSHQEST